MSKFFKFCLPASLGALLGLGTVWAGEGCLPVEVGNPDGNYLIPGVQGRIPYGADDPQTQVLDAYVQRGGQLRPAVVVVHGGEWHAGSRVTHVGQFLELLTQAGFNWFSLDYRMGRERPHPAALDDLRAALAFVRCNAEQFGVAADRIALLGEDSGGHLAALLATERPAGVRALVALGGVFDLAALDRSKIKPEVLRYFGVEAGDDAEALRRASPTHLVTEGMPAVLAVHGAADSEVPPRQSRRFCREVTDKGGDCEVVEVEGAIHRPENWTPSQWGYKRRLTEWLFEKLAPRPPAHLPHDSKNLLKNIVYGEFVDRQGQTQSLELDAWIPSGPGPFPAVVLAHGGGWEAGDKVTYLTPVLEPLAKAGFAWFSIDYRLTPEYSNSDQLNDLRRAIRFVRHGAERFRIDPRRIGVLGESASGQMAMLVASEPCPGIPDDADPVDRQPCDHRAVVSFYGVYDFLPMVKDAGPRSLLVRLFGISELDDAARAVLKRHSPLFQVHAEMPPVLLIHGTDEFLWEQGQRMRERLEELGVDNQMIALEGAPHGMENWEGHPEWEVYKERLIQWLHRTLRE